MRRRVELDRSQFMAETRSSRTTENNTRDWCRIDEISRNRAIQDRLLRERVEAEAEQRLAQRECEARERRVAAEQEREKAEQLFEERRRATGDKKQRLRLREECEELRTLEAQLRTAYIAKERAFQMGEKRAKELQEKISAERDRKAAEEQDRQSREEDQRKAVEVQREKVEFRKCLQQQMTETFLRKRVRYEEFIREKQWIDEITQRLQEEQQAELEQKLRRVLEATAAVQEYRAYREASLAKQRQHTDEENRRICVYLQEKEAKERRDEEQRRAVMEQKNALAERLTRQLDAREAEERSREQVLLELNAREVAKREEVRLRKALEDQLRARVQVRMELEAQREFRWVRQQQEQQEERMFREQQLRQMAEDDRVELLSNEMRRRKQVEHRRAVEALLEQRRAERVQRMNVEKEAHDRELGEAKRVQAMIEEERIKILQEHAKELIGFLPPGLLRASDREQLPLPGGGK